MEWKEEEETEVVENCTVEWHKRRGVLYVHNKDTGTTILRVCKLPISKNKLATGQIDITIGHGVMIEG